MQDTAAKSRRREICWSFTCISPWTVLWRLINGGKSRIDDGDRLDEDFSEIAAKERVGYGLIYLVRSEVNKMIELRRRIESLLQHLETEIDDDKRLNISSPSAKTKTLRLHAEELILNRTSQSLRMDELEAELEDEFDRLQLRMDGEFSYHEFNLLNIHVEKNEGGEESLCDKEDERGGGGGVCARDLERRLHQVLEWRQEERIKELESRLEDALQQLEEKERELSLLYTFPPSNFMRVGSGGTRRKLQGLY